MDPTGVRSERGGENSFLPQSLYWKVFESFSPLEDEALMAGDLAMHVEDWHCRHEHRRILMRRMPLPVLPNELLLHIFSYLPASDLYRVACTCWAFYNLSIKEMNKDVTFNLANERVLYSSLLWKTRTPEMDKVPKALLVTANRSNSFGTLYNRFRTFVSLQALVFNDIDLAGTPRVWDVLASFPNLRRLSFIKCLLPPCPPDVATTLTTLPIEELDMLFVTWEVSAPPPPFQPHVHLGHHQVPMLPGTMHSLAHQNNLNVNPPPLPPQGAHHHAHGWQTMHAFLYAPLAGPPPGQAPPGPNPHAVPPFTHIHGFNNQTGPLPSPSDTVLARYGALNLTAAPNLIIMRLDWTEAMATYLFDDTLMRAPLNTANLHTLELRGLDETKAMGGHLNEYLHRTARLLRQSPRLQRIGMMPDTRLKRLPRPLDLRHVHTYHGSLEAMNALRITETVKHVTGLNEIHPTRLSVYFAKGLPVVESVELRLQVWDVEVLHCAVYAFPGVRDLRIKYYGADMPIEQTLGSFAYIFLPRLPNLEVLHIYGVGPMYPKDRVVRDGFKYMGKKLRSLLEVRLQAGAMWRRASVEDDDWCMRVDAYDRSTYEDKF